MKKLVVFICIATLSGWIYYKVSFEESLPIKQETSNDNIVESPRNPPSIETSWVDYSEHANSLDEKQDVEYEIAHPVDKNVELGYQLKITDKSKESYIKYFQIEYCIGYMEAVARYGSITEETLRNENDYGLDSRVIINKYNNAQSKCSPYLEQEISYLSKVADQKLLESAELGNEIALQKYAHIINQRAMYMESVFPEDEIDSFNKKAIEILYEFYKKYHLDSMITLALLLSNSTDFPETYNPDLAIEVLKRYQDLTQKDMSHIIDNI